MLNGKNIIDGNYFECDKCGKTYSFEQSYLIVRKGTFYRSPLTGEKGSIAEQDLCRDCSGMTLKFSPGVESKLVSQINMEVKGVSSKISEAFDKV